MMDKRAALALLVTGAVLTTIVVLGGAATAMARSFKLERMPKGQSVTLPQPATTTFKLTSRIALKATDLPQMVRFEPINAGRGQVTISIYDSASERVQYAKLKSGLPFLYSFKRLDRIVVVPSLKPSETTAVRARVRVESDKPLNIAH